jgi:hypothetical protein
MALMKTTVSLREVVDALDIATDEMSSYVNRSTGQVLTISHEELQLAEEDTDPDMPDWQRDVVAEARKVLESKDWLELPSKFDINEWEIMDRFGRSLSKAVSQVMVDKVTAIRRDRIEKAIGCLDDSTPCEDPQPYPLQGFAISCFMLE